jgi:hypothetical protein
MRSGSACAVRCRVRGVGILGVVVVVDGRGRVGGLIGVFAAGVVVLGGSLTEEEEVVVDEGEGDEGLGAGLARSGERKGFFSVEAA